MFKLYSDKSKVERALSVIDKITYKPNWQISYVIDERNEAVTITIASSPVPDVNDQSVQTVRHNQCLVDFFFISHLSEEQLIQLVRRQLVGFEIHELDEWFMVDGKRVNEPHK